MAIEIREETPATLSAYAGITIAFDVVEAFDVETRPGSEHVDLRRRSVDRRYVKDYDALDGGPLSWPQRFDLSKWGLLAAFDGSERVGGAADACEGADEALLWDIRVSPAQRGRGVGSALLSAVEAWAEARGCRQLKVETQNVNVPACAFYARHGFTLQAADRLAYPSLPDEIRLLWSKALGRAAARR